MNCQISGNFHAVPVAETVAAGFSSDVPSNETPIMAGVRWGDVRSHGSPAQRLSSILFARVEEPIRPIAPERTVSKSLGRFLCAGVDYNELGRAVYARLDSLDAFGKTPPSVEQLIAWVAEPFQLHDKDKPKQPCHLTYQQINNLSECLFAIARMTPLTDAMQLREWLAKLPGIDRCAASWIVRFSVGESEQIVPITRYVLENGQLIGLFPLDAQIERDYLSLEDRFLQLCDRMQVGPWELQTQYIMDLVVEAEGLKERLEALKSAIH